MRAAIYARISSDPTGQAAGVGRQLDDCRALCTASGWEIVGEHVDNNISASRYTRRPRPGYDALLAQVDAGEVDAIVAWHTDRLHRRPLELEGLLTVLDGRPIRVRTVTAGTLDLDTASGRMVARMLAAADAHESEHKSERILRSTEARARSGAAPSGPRPYGWAPDRITLDPVEGPLLREAADRVLAGDTVTDVFNDWVAAGVRTRFGGPWLLQSLRKMLVAPRLAGIRTYRGQPVGRGAWEPVVTEEEHRRLCALILRPDHHLTPRGQGRVPYLTGVIFCGRCNRGLVHASGRTRGTTERSHRYRCSTQIGGCGHNGIDAVKAEAEVVARMWALADLSPTAVLPDPATATAAELAGADQRLAAAEVRLAEIGEMLGAGDIDRAQATAATTRARRERDEARDDVSRLAATGAQPVDLADLRARWEAGDLDRTGQRAAVRRVVRRVDLAPFEAVGRYRFQPERLTVTFGPVG